MQLIRCENVIMAELRSYRVLHLSQCVDVTENLFYSFSQNSVSVLWMLALYCLHVVGGDSHREHRQGVVRSTDTALSFRLALLPVLLSVRIMWSHGQWHENYTIFLNLPFSWEKVKSLKMGNRQLKICNSPDTYYQCILFFSIPGMFLKSFRQKGYNNISLMEA